MSSGKSRPKSAALWELWNIGTSGCLVMTILTSLGAYGVPVPDWIFHWAPLPVGIMLGVVVAKIIEDSLE